MKILSLLLLSGALAVTASASVIITTTPSNGAISGNPGQTIGWGFSIKSTTEYLIVNSVDLLPGASIGTFTNFLTLRPNFIVSPSTVATVENFNLAGSLGLAAFSILPGTPVASQYNGSIFVGYDLYSVSPNDPVFDPFTDFVGSDTVRLDAQVSVIAAPPPTATPEPSSLGLTAAAILVMQRFGRRLASRIPRE